MTAPYAASPAETSAPPTAPQAAVRAPQRRRRRGRQLILFLIVVLFGLIGAGAGAAYGATRPTMYTAHTFVLVAPVPGKSGDLTGVDLAAAYARVSSDPSVAGPALSNAGLPSQPKDIKKSVSATASPDAPLIDIAGHAKTADAAARIANTAATGLLDHEKDLKATPGFTLVQVTPATVPDQADSAPLPIYTLVGLLAGLAVGGGIAALRRP